MTVKSPTTYRLANQTLVDLAEQIARAAASITRHHGYVRAALAEAETDQISGFLHSGGIIEATNNLQAAHLHVRHLVEFGRKAGLKEFEVLEAVAGTGRFEVL